MNSKSEYSSVDLNQMNFFKGNKVAKPADSQEVATSMSILNNVKQENELLDNVNTNLLQKIDQNEANIGRLKDALEAQDYELKEKSDALDKA